jgi:hypothetical protein
MTDWQPIETAPKDGTDILVTRRDGDGSDWYAVAQWWVERWVFLYGDSKQIRDPVFLCFQPTHWRPLPDPPKVKP